MQTQTITQCATCGQPSGGMTDCHGCQMATLTQDNGPIGDALGQRLIDALGIGRAREMQLTDEADEARWVDATLGLLAAECPPPPF